MSIKKILIVDSSQAGRLSVSALLESKGYVAITAGDGHEAMDKARREQPDLVLIDVVIPGPNGFQVTRDMTRAPETQHIPVVICGRRRGEVDRVWGLRQGARNYLVKPLAERELFDTIASLE